MNINRVKISTDFHGDICFTHARGVILDNGFGIMTTQPLRLSGCDVFYGMYVLRTNDGGKSWSKPEPSKTLTRKAIGEGLEIAMCDASPLYHEKSGKILLIGHSATYLNDEHASHPKRHTLYSVYDESLGDFSPFEIVDMPYPDTLYYSSGSGSSQFVVEDNGDILVPIYHMDDKASLDPWHDCYHSSVMRCSFDGRRLSLIEIGSPLSIETPRGLYEPSLIKHGGKYYLALRADHSGYIATSDDGLNFSRPYELVWENGESIGNYCTQQHWISLGEKLYLVYTRRGADNDNVFRHRAPLFIAELDTERMCLIRATETIAVPNRGARLGNFGAQSRSGDAFIFASEWMQTTEPDQTDYKKCMKYGSDNSIFVVRITEN